MAHCPAQKGPAQRGYLAPAPPCAEFTAADMAAGAGRNVPAEPDAAGQQYGSRAGYGQPDDVVCCGRPGAEVGGPDCGTGPAGSPRLPAPAGRGPPCRTNGGRGPEYRTLAVCVPHGYTGLLPAYQESHGLAGLAGERDRPGVPEPDTAVPALQHGAGRGDTHPGHRHPPGLRAQSADRGDPAQPHGPALQRPAGAVLRAVHGRLFNPDGEALAPEACHCGPEQVSEPGWFYTPSG